MQMVHNMRLKFATYAHMWLELTKFATHPHCLKLTKFETYAHMCLKLTKFVVTCP